MSPLPRAPRFEPDPDTAFIRELRERVDAWFTETGRSRHGNAEAKLKAFGTIAVLVGAYVFMLAAPVHGSLRMAAALVMGFASLMMIYQVGHDASHGSLFKSRRLNKAFAHAFDLVGSNAYAWHHSHDRIHHVWPSVVGIDQDIMRPAPLLRLHSGVPWRPYHRYQVFYAPFLYLIIGLFGVTVRDFKDLGMLPNRNLVPGMDLEHPPREKVILVVSKVFYFSYTLLIPWLVLDVSFLWVLGTFIGVHLIVGAVLALSLIPVHVSAFNKFPVLVDGVVPQDRIRHAFDTCTDFSADNVLLTAALGGLNTHVIHHLFPQIHHVHLRHIIPMMAELAEKHGIEYRSVGFWTALRAHFQLLYLRGQPPEAKELSGLRAAG